MGLNTMELQHCMYEVVAYYINDSRWFAIQYTLMVIPATFLAYLLTRSIPQQAILLSLSAGTITATLIWISLTPPLMATLAAATGIPLGGLIAQNRFSKKHA